MNSDGGAEIVIETGQTVAGCIPATPVNKAALALGGLFMVLLIMGLVGIILWTLAQPVVNLFDRVDQLESRIEAFEEESGGDTESNSPTYS